MRAQVQLAELTAEERQAVQRLARSRTDEARLVQRAQIIEQLAGASGPLRWPSRSA